MAQKKVATGRWRSLAVQSLLFCQMARPRIASLCLVCFLFLLIFTKFCTGLLQVELPSSNSMQPYSKPCGSHTHTLTVHCRWRNYAQFTLGGNIYTRRAVNNTVHQAKTYRNRTIHPIFLDHMPTRTHTNHAM